MLPIDLIVDMKDVEKDFGSLTNLCRDLARKQFHPNSTVTVMRGETVALKTEDIYAAAELVVDGDHFRKYRGPRGWKKPTDAFK